MVIPHSTGRGPSLPSNIPNRSFSNPYLVPNFIPFQINMRGRSLLASATSLAATLLLPGASAAPPYNMNKETNKELVNKLTDEWADYDYNHDGALPRNDQRDLNRDPPGRTDGRDIEEDIFIDAASVPSIPIAQQVGLLDDDDYQVGLLDDDEFQVGLLDDDDTEVGLLDDENDMRVGLLDDDEEGPEEDNESIDVSSDDDNYDDLSFDDDDDDDDDDDEVPVQLSKSKSDNQYPVLNLDATDPEEMEETTVVDDENTDDSDLTEEDPWDAQQNGETDDDDKGVPNLFDDTKEQHANPGSKSGSGRESKMLVNSKSGSLIVEDQVNKQSEKMQYPGRVEEELPSIQTDKTAEEEYVTENDLVTLDDYQIDNTVDSINDSLEKALNTVERTDTLPLRPMDDIPSFELDQAGSQFFPDENDRRFVNSKPYIKPTSNDDGPSVGLIFLATLLLFLLYKSPRIKVCAYSIERTKECAYQGLPTHSDTLYLEQTIITKRYHIMLEK
ncbi:hypothetical protein BX666DRAFT_343449 [Dichotomocladium elegans]|nr:hypothetical protein BX666DRAFT_343449 [Dichotomocladium elegans]